jgi:alpha-glucosidase (family GH31 glycosyl hydrolase)
MSPIVSFNADGTSKLTFIALGGVLDVLFFMHGSVATIVKSYRSFVGGRPTLPPFWALGWQQGSNSWNLNADVQATIDGYQNAGLPLETVRLGLEFIQNFDAPISFKAKLPLKIVAEMLPSIKADTTD